INENAHTDTATYTRTHTHTVTRSEEHTSELQSHLNLVCRLLLEKKKYTTTERRSDTNTHRYLQLKSDTHMSTRAVHTYLSSQPSRPTSHDSSLLVFFFFKDRATPEFSPFPLPAAFPI